MYFGISTAKDYWEQIALKNYEEYYTGDNHLDPRLAFNAAITAFHYHEWIFSELFGIDDSKLGLLNVDVGRVHEESYRKTKLGEYRKAIVQNGCPHFWIFHDIANGAKHLTLSRSKAQYDKSEIDVGEWGDIGWEDLGGSDFGYDYFLISVNRPGDHEVRQFVFENCLRDFIEWWNNNGS